MKYLLMLSLVLCGYAGAAFAHKDEPPCNDESLQDARDRTKDDDKHHHHHHD